MVTQTVNTWTLDEAIVEHIAEAVIYADREGLIQRWNASAVQLFGFSAAEAIGQSLDLMIPEPLRAAHWRGFYAAMNSGALRLNGRATLTRGLHQSGRKLYVEMSLALERDAAAYVTSGLKDGDKVILSPSGLVADGVKVAADATGDSAAR